MNVFWFDRVQYVEETNQVIIYEFFKCSQSDIDGVGLVMNSKGEVQDFRKPRILDYSLRNIFDNFTYQKHQCIKRLIMYRNVVYYIILYNDNDELEKKVICYEPNKHPRIISFFDFKELQNWFLKLNEVNKSSKSKKLGEIRTNDRYADKILKSIWKSDINEDDDQGLEYTIKLLTLKNQNGDYITYETKGFDYDLFIYFALEDKIMNIEFALNNKYSEFRTNTSCTPMKYCWGRNPASKIPDNQRKYNNLWITTKILGGALFVLNYSESNNIYGLQHIREMSTTYGIMEETKFRIMPKNFEECVSELGESLTITHLYDILNYYSESSQTYSKEFFENFYNNKKYYN